MSYLPTPGTSYDYYTNAFYDHIPHNTIDLNNGVGVTGTRGYGSPSGAAQVAASFDQALPAGLTTALLHITVVSSNTPTGFTTIEVDENPQFSAAHWLSGGTWTSPTNIALDGVPISFSIPLTIDPINLITSRWIQILGSFGDSTHASTLTVTACYVAAPLIAQLGNPNITFS